MSYSAHAVQWNGKGDDNRGLIYGIEYMDDDEVSDVEWFKSARIRDGVLELYLKDLKTFGADDAMTSAEFAKLMGAYPEPAGNPSPAYGGFMDNSAANFSWVQNNDYFGAESKKGWSCKYCGHNRKTTHQHRNPNPTLADEVCSKCGVNADFDGELGEHYGAETLEDQCKECSAVEGGEIDGCDECNITIPYNGRYYRQESMRAETNAEEPSFECDLCGKSKHKKIQNKNGQIFYYCTNEEPDGNGCVWGDTAEGKWMMDGKMYYNGMVVGIKNPESAYLTNNCGGCGSSFSVSDEEPGEDGDILCSNCSSEFNADEMMMSIMSKCPDCQSKNMEHFVTDYCQDCAASFNAESKKDDLTKVKEYTNRIMEQDPYVMAEFGPFGYYKLLEHPTAGDLSPLLFYTPIMGGLLMRTGFFDTYEMNDELAEKLSKAMVKQIKQNTYFEDEDWSDFLFDAETFEAQPNFNEETQEYEGTIKEIYKDPKTNELRVKGRWYYPQGGEWVEYDTKGCQYEGCAQMYSPEWDSDDYCTSACVNDMTICGKNKPYLLDLKVIADSLAGQMMLHDGWEDGAYGDFCQSLTEDVVYDRDGEEQEKRIMCNDCDYEKAEYGAESFNAESFEAQAKTGHEITTSGGKGSFYLPMKDYSKEHAQMLFKDWKPSAYPYEKRITQDTKNDYCANCEKENVHYQFYLKQSNSRRPDMRFVNGASYCKYDENECGANLCNVCADDNDCENCGAEICIDCADKSERIDNSKICVDCREYDASFDAEYGLTPTDQINNSIGVAVPMADPLGLPEDLIAIQAGGVINGVPAEEFYAEMDLVTDGMVAITNTNDDTVGVIEVMDDKDDDEMVEISIQNENLEEIGAFTLDDGMVLDNQDDYLAEMKKPSLLALALGVGAVLLGGSLLKDKLVKNADNDIQEVLENDPELIENPNIGDLSPADYEELVVESTGYAVDVIPMSLDGSFMGSRFAALPTERYVEYNDPGIGAHIDVALNRDEDFLEPEMAMVQAAEDVKEAQAPGQSPYLSVDGQEPKDFSYRVLKETHPVSLDPAVVPFIPQSMAGYTGNANRPPSVYNKMFNLGVLGQTPLFVPGNNDDIGASHTGSRRATPSKMGSIGGPLSDAVNASYTDGQTSKSLAQWSIENSVQQTSDTEAMVIDRSSGNTKRIRRV